MARRWITEQASLEAGASLGTGTLLEARRGITTGALLEARAQDFAVRSGFWQLLPGDHGLGFFVEGDAGHGSVVVMGEEKQPLLGDGAGVEAFAFVDAA